MTKERPLGISEVEKLLVTGAALTGLLLFSSAPRLHADEEKCHRQLARADHRLHEAVEHHGWDSRQAVHARHELRKAREHCWRTYHRWWDEDEQRWHTDRDWDDEHGYPH